MTATIDLVKRFGGDHWKDQPRDGRGRWTDTLNLAGRLPTGEVEQLIGSDVVEGEDSAVPLAIIQGPTGIRARIGVGIGHEDISRWRGANLGGTANLDEAGIARLHAGVGEMLSAADEGVKREQALTARVDELTARQRELIRSRYPNLTRSQGRELDKIDRALVDVAAELRMQERMQQDAVDDLPPAARAEFDQLAELIRREPDSRRRQQLIEQRLQLHDTREGERRVGFVVLARRRAARIDDLTANQDYLLARRGELTSEVVELSPEDQRELDSVTAELDRVDNELLDLLDGGVLAEGVVPADWADLVFEASMSDGGPRFLIDIRPYDAGGDWLAGVSDTESTLTAEQLAQLRSKLDNITGDTLSKVAELGGMMRIDLVKRFAGGGDHWKDQPRDRRGRWTHARGRLAHELMELADRHRGSDPEFAGELAERAEQAAAAAGMRTVHRRGDLVRFDPQRHRVTEGETPAVGTMVQVRVPGLDIEEHKLSGGDSIAMVNIAPSLVAVTGDAQKVDFDTPMGKPAAQPRNRATARLAGTRRPDTAQLAGQLAALPVSEMSRAVIRNTVKDMNVADLRSLAGELKIPGRSKMRKADLKEAIEQHTVGNALNARENAYFDQHWTGQEGGRVTPPAERARATTRTEETASAETAPLAQLLTGMTEPQIRQSIAGMTVAQLRELAKELGPTVSARGTKKQIQESIVEGTIGFRERSRAIGGGTNLWNNRLPLVAERAERFTTSVGRAIAQAYSDIRSEQGANDLVSLADIRDALAGRFTRQEIDAEVRRLNLAPAAGGLTGFKAFPQSNQKILTQRERDAAITVGIDQVHNLQILGDIPAPRTRR